MLPSRAPSSHLRLNYSLYGCCHAQSMTAGVLCFAGCHSQSGSLPMCCLHRRDHMCGGGHGPWKGASALLGERIERASQRESSLLIIEPRGGADLVKLSWAGGGEPQREIPPSRSLWEQAAGRVRRLIGPGPLQNRKQQVTPKRDSSIGDVFLLLGNFSQLMLWTRPWGHHL